EDACREALTNAIAHRDYSIEGRNIEIKIFDDRMDITSPGGLLSNIKIKELTELSGVHQSRNSLVARVLKEIGYMREMGEGIRRIYNLMKQNDLVAPELKSDKNSFSIILHSKSVFTEEDQRHIEAFDFLNLSREEMLIILFGKNGQLLSPKQIYSHLELVDWDDYRKIIDMAQNKGILVNVLSRQKIVNAARSKRISQRDIKRLKVRTPKECEEGVKKVFEELKVMGYKPKIINAHVQNMMTKLGRTSIYHFSSPLPFLSLLRILNLIDNSNTPTSILRNIWGKDEIKKISNQLQREPTKRIAIKNQKQHVKPTITNDIYIENIDYDTQQHELNTLFSKYGEVIKVTIPTDFYTGRGRGFAFIKMRGKGSAINAIRGLHNTTFKDRIIRLNW
ncbi:MAG: hypothetical protein IIA45_13320, partial [Bacteroidetes bacterium]|nr:hypothetical protein [Bacteroidota bacterium]